MVFNEVQVDLEAEGYEVTPFLLPACAVNAPHRRDRIWFVAHSKSNGSAICKLGKSEGGQQIQTRSYINGFKGLGNASNTNGNGLNKCNCNNEINPGERRLNALGDINKSNGDGNVADTKHKRLERQYRERERCTEHRSDQRILIGSKNKFIASNPNVIGLRGESDGIGESGLISKKSEGDYWQNFPTVSPICFGDDGLSDRLDSITFPKWRTESIKAGGNAIVPQVVHQIFKAIEEYERITTANTN
jgi:DNA (cytosine-5)-methyltransferase 1